MNRDCEQCEFNAIDEWLEGDDEFVQTRCVHPDLDRPWPGNVLPNFTATPPGWCPLGAEDVDE